MRCLLWLSPQLAATDRDFAGERMTPEQIVEVDMAAPQKRQITGEHGHKVHAGLALDAVQPE